MSATFEDSLLNLVREFDDDDLQNEAAGVPQPTYPDAPAGLHSMKRRNSLVGALSMMADVLKSRSARLSFGSVNTVGTEEDRLDVSEKKLNSNKKINKKVKRIAWFSRLDRTIRKNRTKCKVLPQ